MISYNGNLKNTAKALRKSMTEQERNLWYKYLRFYPVKFYRQKIIGNYIVDFYCNKVNLVIELDGSQHYNKSSAEYDEARTMYLSSLGIKVVRFSNSDCINNFNEICTAIDSLVKSSISETPQTS